MNIRLTVTVTVYMKPAQVKQVSSTGKKGTQFQPSHTNQTCDCFVCAFYFGFQFLFVLERMKLGGVEFETDWAKESENDQNTLYEIPKTKNYFKKSQHE